MTPRSNRSLRASDEFTYRGIDAVFLENDALRVMVLPGKGGDVLEFRDKRTDVDVLWQTHHNWQPPESRYVPSADPTAWMDHYPGGWQLNLPLAGFTDDFGGVPYGIHGESALLPWDYRVRREDDRVSLVLWTELVRYPFEVERELTLEAGESRLRIDESVTNRGEVELDYIWQQHLTLGAPLLDPAARLDVPAESGVVEAYGEDHANARLESGATFDWPHAPASTGETVDLRRIPGPERELHDVAYATDLAEGWYALTNPDLDLGFGFEFPVDPFECVWYWQPLGGDERYPYFGRNYNVGLEPTTAYPSAPVPDAPRENGTIDTIGPGETLEASFTAVTYGGLESVESIDDGAVEGVPID
jgi:hypothetical protein